MAARQLAVEGREVLDEVGLDDEEARGHEGRPRGRSASPRVELLPFHYYHASLEPASTVCFAGPAQGGSVRPNVQHRWVAGSFRSRESALPSLASALFSAWK